MSKRLRNILKYHNIDSSKLVFLDDVLVGLIGTMRFGCKFSFPKNIDDSTKKCVFDLLRAMRSECFVYVDKNMIKKGE